MSVVTKLPLPGAAGRYSGTALMRVTAGLARPRLNYSGILPRCFALGWPQPAHERHPAAALVASVREKAGAVGERARPIDRRTHARRLPQDAAARARANPRATSGCATARSSRWRPDPCRSTPRKRRGPLRTLAARSPGPARREGLRQDAHRGDRGFEDARGEPPPSGVRDRNHAARAIGEQHGQAIRGPDAEHDAGHARHRRIGARRGRMHAAERAL